MFLGRNDQTVISPLTKMKAPIPIIAINKINYSTCMTLLYGFLHLIK